MHKKRNGGKVLETLQSCIKKTYEMLKHASIGESQQQRLGIIRNANNLDLKSKMRRLRFKTLVESFQMNVKIGSIATTSHMPSQIRWLLKFTKTKSPLWKKSSKKVSLN